MHIQSTDLLIEQEKMISMLEQESFKSSSKIDQESFKSSSKKDELFETSKKSILNSIREAAENMPLQIGNRDVGENMPLQMISHQPSHSAPIHSIKTSEQ
jgi:hypothetical protein